MNVQPRPRFRWSYGIGFGFLAIAAWLFWVRWDTFETFERARFIGGVVACWFMCGTPLGFVAGWLARRMFAERDRRTDL